MINEDVLHLETKHKVTKGLTLVRTAESPSATSGDGFGPQTELETRLFWCAALKLPVQKEAAPGTFLDMTTEGNGRF